MYIQIYTYQGRRKWGQRGTTLPFPQFLKKYKKCAFKNIENFNKLFLFSFYLVNTLKYGRGVPWII